MTALYPNVNDTLNREHSRVLSEYALALKQWARPDVSAHVAQAEELASRLRVDGRRERAVVTDRDLRFLDKIVERLQDLAREHPITSEMSRVTLAQGIQQLRDLAAPFVSSPPAADGQS